MECTYPVDNTLEIDKKLFLKMNFLYNAVDDGWSVTKKTDKYIFSKPHEKRKEIYSEKYLSEFINSNIKLHRPK